jgi:hypothetical protein
MFEVIKNKILEVRRACGVEVSLLNGGEMMIQAVIVKLQKHVVVKEKEVHSLGSAEALRKHVSAGTPVAVALNGKGILHKRVPLEALTGNIFETVLPNGNPADFYMEICPYETWASVYLVRRTVLDKVVEDLARCNLRVLSVSMGVAGLQYLMPYLNMEKEMEEIRTNHFLVRIDQGRRVTDIEPLAYPLEEARPTLEYSIGNHYVFSRGIMAFGAAMGLFAGVGGAPHEITNDTIRSAREDYTYFNYFRAATWSFLGFVFAILFINFFIYNHYFSSNEEHNASQALTQAEEKRAEKLELVIGSKERWISRYGWDRSSRLSLYADRIAALVPDDATLTVLKINPLHAGFASDNNPLSFQQDTIQLTGTCEDPAELNRFANNLRNIRSFRQIDIKSYLYKKETQNGIFSMEIITL